MERITDKLGVVLFVTVTKESSLSGLSFSVCPRSSTPSTKNSGSMQMIAEVSLDTFSG